jgi:hypothetical protein
MALDHDVSRPRAAKPLPDTRLGTLVVVLGFIGVGVGLKTHADPFAVPPSLDGIMASALVGFVLATLHGLDFRRALAVLSPALGVLAVVAVRCHESPFALVGINLVLFGAIGLLAGRLSGRVAV